jgi:hypothetical protein
MTAAQNRMQVIQEGRYELAEFVQRAAPGSTATTTSSAAERAERRFVDAQLPDFSQPLQIGSKSKINATFSSQLATGWSDPKPLCVEAEIVSSEITSTKAGNFETYRVERTATCADGEISRCR